MAEIFRTCAIGLCLQKKPVEKVAFFLGLRQPLGLAISLGLLIALVQIVGLAPRPLLILLRSVDFNLPYKILTKKISKSWKKNKTKLVLSKAKQKTHLASKNWTLQTLQLVFQLGPAHTQAVCCPEGRPISRWTLAHEAAPGAGFQGP